MACTCTAGGMTSSLCACRCHLTHSCRWKLPRLRRSQGWMTWSGERARLKSPAPVNLLSLQVCPPCSIRSQYITCSLRVHCHNQQQLPSRILRRTYSEFGLPYSVHNWWGCEPGMQWGIIDERACIGLQTFQPCCYGCVSALAVVSFAVAWSYVTASILWQAVRQVRKWIRLDARCGRWPESEVMLPALYAVA